jgi:hypothetical protein
MTAQRQERNRSSLGFVFMALLAGVAAGPSLQTAAHAATTERVVVDRYSGLALGGFDPVAYFTDARAMAGRVDVEASQAGAVWRFRSEGNRAVFLAHPDIYGPQFGGYDPTGVARGVAVAGGPRFWVIVGQRLFLFGAAENRDAFAADPTAVMRAATRRWPNLQETLAR